MSNRYYNRRRYPEWDGSDLANYTHTVDGLIANGQLEFRAMGADRYGDVHFQRGIPDRKSVFCVEIVSNADGTVRKALDGKGYTWVQGNDVKSNKIQLRAAFAPNDDDVVILKYQRGEGC